MARFEPEISGIDCYSDDALAIAFDFTKKKYRIL